MVTRCPLEYVPWPFSMADVGECQSAADHEGCHNRAGFFSSTNIRASKLVSRG